MGGQSAVYAFRQALMRGSVPGYARGGAIDYAPRQQVVAVPMGATSHTTRNDYGLSADTVNIYTPSPSAFRREIKSTPYRSKARPR